MLSVGKNIPVRERSACEGLVLGSCVNIQERQKGLRQNEGYFMSRL